MITLAHNSTAAQIETAAAAVVANATALKSGTKTYAFSFVLPNGTTMKGSKKVTLPKIVAALAASVAALPKPLVTHVANDGKGQNKKAAKKVVAKKTAPADATADVLATPRGPKMAHSFSGLVGCVRERKSQSTGTMIRTFVASQSGLRVSTFPWTNRCEEHESLAGFSTRRDARIAVSQSRAWCPDCKALPVRMKATVAK